MTNAKDVMTLTNHSPEDSLQTLGGGHKRVCHTRALLHARASDLVLVAGWRVIFVSGLL